jgi:hypothetical protein
MKNFFQNIYKKIFSHKPRFARYDHTLKKFVPVLDLEEEKYWAKIFDNK